MSAPVYQQWLRDELFELAPLNISIIDRDYGIVAANRNFVSLFGEARGRKCFEVHMRRDEPCERCAVAKTFLDGRVRVNEEMGVDRNGHVAHYLVHVAPIRDEDGSIPYVIEMSTDITETKRLKLEYQTLFEQVPCFVTVLNRDLRIVRANERFREKFGDLPGQRCFQVFKRKSSECEDCPVRQTFADGQMHTSEHVGVSKTGETTHYIVTAAPASRGAEGFSHVIEMALDVTDLRETERELRRARMLRRALVEYSTDPIIGTGPEGKMLLFNPAAAELFGIPADELLDRPLPEGLLPAEFEKLVRESAGSCELAGADITTRGGESIPVRLSGRALERDGEFLGTAAFLQDLRTVRQLEKEKIDAERLAAVGQTVAGLAHGIKNILTGLEGGMYFVKSGLKGGRTERLEEGWGMLSRNMEKISTLARSLLSFSKGRTPDVQVVPPERIVAEIVALYRDAAAEDNVLLVAEVEGPPAPAPLDEQAIHTCLANLVSNAIDACRMGEQRPCRVCLKLFERDGEIIFEVEDEGCGMDQEVRKLAFTNFFTTKGTGGTGLGLLQTRKITQEHGGRIDFDSTPGQGSVFRLILPRDRLPAPGVPKTEEGA